MAMCLSQRQLLYILSAVMIIVCVDCNLDQRLTVLFNVPRLVATPSGRCTLHSRLASLIKFALFLVLGASNSRRSFPWTRYLQSVSMTGIWLAVTILLVRPKSIWKTGSTADTAQHVVYRRAMPRKDFIA